MKTLKTQYGNYTVLPKLPNDTFETPCNYDNPKHKHKVRVKCLIHDIDNITWGQPEFECYDTVLSQGIYDLLNNVSPF